MMRVFNTEIVKNYLTAPDGESYAPGRLMGFMLFLAFLVILGVMTWHVCQLARTLADWQTYMSGLAVFVPAMSGACVGLVLGMAPTDSGGAWWSRENRPPPPPGDGDGDHHQ